MSLERWLYKLSLRIRSLFRRRDVESELDEELRYHLDIQTEANMQRGMTEAEARRAALLSLEGIEGRKEDCRDMRGLNWLDNTVRDFSYAIRQMGKNRSFAWTAVFVLALGIAAAVSIFGFVEAALIKPLPYRDPSRLVSAFVAAPKAPQVPLAYLDFVDWKRQNTVFSSIDAYALNGGFTLSSSSSSGAEPVTGTRVSAGFFSTLGVVPVIGRDFHPNEDAVEAPHAVLIGYEAWQARFGGRTDVLGETVTLNGIPRTVIGVLPRDFHFAPVGRGEFWATLRATDSCESRRGCQNLNTVARLKDGISIEAAASGMTAIAQQLQRQYPDTNRDFGGATLVPLSNVVVGKIRPILLMLLAGACLLLLIAWVNVTTLLLTRSDGRRHEIAIRGSLGATSARLLHQFAIEGLALAVVGGTLGLILADWAMRLLVNLVPAQMLYGMPYLRGLGLNSHTIAFACGLTVLSAVLFAVVPVTRVSLSQAIDGLREGTRGGSGMMWRRLGTSLVVVEVALALVLMSGAALLGKSLYALLHIETGMKTDDLASVGLKWPLSRYDSDEKRRALAREVAGKVSAIPGVTSVAISLTSPLGSVWGNTSFHVKGRSIPDERSQALHRQVSAGYFSTLHVRLIRGRFFRETEDASQPRVAVVNRSLANRYFAGQNPIGMAICHDWAPDAPMEIVGVVDDVKEGPLETANLPVLYVPFDQRPQSWFAVLVRTAPNQQAALAAIAPTIHQIDREIAVSAVTSMNERIEDSSVAYVHRSSAWLVGGFAAVAFILGVVGLYGVVAYSVSHRTREIGVRMALGADPRSVYRLVLSEAARLIGIGVALGLGGSLAAATLIRGLFYGVRKWDVPTLAAVASVLAMAALLATYIPARRAALTNPTEALRVE